MEIFRAEIVIFAVTWHTTRYAVPEISRLFLCCNCGAIIDILFCYYVICITAFEQCIVVTCDWSQKQGLLTIAVTSLLKCPVFYNHLSFCVWGFPNKCLFIFDFLIGFSPWNVFFVCFQRI